MKGLAVSASGSVEGYEIFIKYLPQSATETDLQEYFAEAGPIIGDSQPCLSMACVACVTQHRAG